ncbi:tRNA (adenosine(37)-N6)-dimethylallyltransferase MiaA [Halocola ammonii]
MKKNRPLLVVISGPTAVGKTKMAIDVANHFDTEIVSADSRQFFKEMSIGTAKPTEEEREQAPHHFVDFLPVDDDYSAGDFERDALQKLEKIFSKKSIAVLTGGSGLYVDAVCRGLDDLPKSDEERKNLNNQLKTEGIEVLQEELKMRDPAFYQKIDLQNPQRLVRALEVCRASGKPFSSFRANTAKERPFDILKVALYTDRKLLYERINMRVDQMIEDGLIDEAESLFPKRNLNALNTVGYKELFSWLNGELSREEAIEEIKKNTRRFAKRQLTWLRKDETYHWIHTGDTDGVLELINKKLKKNGR